MESLEGRAIIDPDMRPELRLPAIARPIVVEDDAAVLRRKLRMAAAVIFFSMVAFVWTFPLGHEWLVQTRWGDYGLIGEYEAPYRHAALPLS